MALIDLKTDLSKRIGSKGSPQTFTDGHSSTIVTGQKTFEPSIRHDVTKDTFTAYNRKGKELKYQYDQQFTSPSLLTTTAPKLQKYYDRALSLPLYPTLTDSEQEKVISLVKKFYA